MHVVCLCVFLKGPGWRTGLFSTQLYTAVFNGNFFSPDVSLLYQLWAHFLNLTIFSKHFQKGPSIIQTLFSTQQKVFSHKHISKLSRRTYLSFKYKSVSTTDTEEPSYEFVERFGRKKKWTREKKITISSWTVRMLIFQMSSNTYLFVWPVIVKRQCSQSPNRNGWHFSIQETGSCI